jgi:hypothetical protein
VDFNDYWNDTTQYGQSKRFFSIVFILLIIFALLAINGAFSFYPYDHLSFWHEWREKNKAATGG